MQSRPSSNRNALAIWVLLILGVGALSVPLLKRAFDAPPTSPPLPGVGTDPDESDATRAIVKTDLAKETAARLRSAGWPEAAADAVVDLNLDWLAIQKEENPAGFEIQLKLLERLGSHPKVFALIEKHPETAALLAGTSSPSPMALSLTVDSRDYEPLAGLFVQYANARDRDRLVAALRSERRMIRKLQQRGILGAEVLFMYDRPPDRGDASADWARDYDRWLHDELETRLGVPDEELASFVNLIFQQGPEIRRRLASDEGFRREFRSNIWPRLNRAAAANQNMFEVFLSDPRVWDLLQLDAGEELLKGTGLVAIDLLYGYPDDDRPPYPPRVRPQVIQILLRREPLSIQALLQFRREPLFIRILEKQISADTRVSVLAKLFQARPNHRSLLATYDRLEGGPLAEEVGPPPHGVITWVPFYYTVYEVPKKWLQGRDATGMDLLQAALDPALLVVDIFTGGGAEVGKRAIVTAGELVETAGERVVVVTLEKRAAEIAARRIGQEGTELIAKKGGETLGEWSLTAMFSEMQSAVRGALGKASTLDVTNLLHVLHRYGGVSRQTFKNLFGLEARVFMRGDAKVFLRLGNVPRAMLGARAADFMMRTSNDLMLGGVVESELGQDSIKGVADTVATGKARAVDALRTWQQHVSALWLLEASRPLVAPTQ